MARPISNLRNGNVHRHALMLAPATLVVLGVVGFSARPLANLRDTMAERQEGVRRAERYSTEAGRRQRLRRIEEAARVDEAVARLRRLLPEGVSELDLHGSTRILARAAGLELESLVVGPAEDAGLPRIGDLVAVRQVSVRGSGAIDSLPRLVSAMRAMGHPVAVLEFTVTRGVDDPSRAELRAVLDVFELQGEPTEHQPGSESPDAGGGDREP